MSATHDDIAAYLEFQRIERNASVRTLRNYSHALNTFEEWRGDAFRSWRDCTADDFIDDTPTSAASNGFTCNKGKNTCTDSTGTDLPDMVENFMDYSANACANSFTKGQVWVMRETVKRGRASFVSVKELDANSQSSFIVYPNPSNGTFTIGIKESLGESNYRVLNLQGKVVAEGTMMQPSKQINLNTAKGIYFVEVTNNGVTQRKRVVVF